VAERPVLLALVGPTASGKTEAGVLIAERLGAEIVSVDSMSVYRGMDVGTAKPTTADRARVPHHLVDVAEPDEDFSVARHQELARGALALIAGRGRPALAVGGTGLYFRALVDGLAFPATDPATRRALEEEAVRLGPIALHDRLRRLDPAAAGVIEPANVRRTVRALEVASVTGRPFSSFAEQWDRYPGEGVRAAGVRMPPEVRRERIEDRVRCQFESGLLQEVALLVERGMGPSLTARQAIGYAEATLHLEGSVSLEEAIARTAKRSRALARRQMAWFRRDPRIRWFDAGEGGAVELVDDLTEYLRHG
jgi:tRNA dimethylallyltransferase